MTVGHSIKSNDTTSRSCVRPDYKAAIDAVVTQEAALQQERNRVVEQSRVVGRVSLFFESVQVAEADSGLQAQVAELRGRVETLEAGLSDDVVEDRLTSILQVVGSDMTGWASAGRPGQ
jgi:hypothetical protein